MRQLIIALGSLAFAVAAQSQQALQCANPDVLNSLVFNMRPESKLVVKRTMPESVAGFRAPAGFTLIGSGVRGPNLSTVVAYKTQLTGKQAFDSWVAFLAAEGWEPEDTQQQQLPFSVAGATPLAAPLCRDGERRNLRVQEIAGVLYGTIVGFETRPARACNAPLPHQGVQFNPMESMQAAQANMPQFAFPESARAAGESVLSNIGGGGRSFSTYTRIQSPDTAATLAAMLARQLTSQGWRIDAEWKGRLSTGSTWARNADDGKQYRGTLEVLSLDGGRYDVGFLVAAMP